MIIGLIVGSFRPHGNTLGVASWVKYCIKKTFPEATIKVYNPISPINLLEAPINPVSPKHVHSPDDYVSAIDREWAHAIAECDAYVILSPEYNESYTGYLKVMIDHIYHEFEGKPGTFVTFSGHGAEKSYQRLGVLMGKLGLRHTGGISFSVPMSYIRGDYRVAREYDDEKREEDVFLKELEGELEGELAKMGQTSELTSEASK
ncbi:DEKNAAC104784 [Brettanomyces naardenensis]|uniref:DEKNAAC104784 n=1 Tax=Brettanomyces naardenensis TaxID=13370 RepID=A0A448YRT7_BRENA|nr:DEKNAAC104784 [Brettanomyces naardenensis]